jgi:hypothetical protein
MGREARANKSTTRRGVAGPRPPARPPAPVSTTTTRRVLVINSGTDRTLEQLLDRITRGR